MRWRACSEIPRLHIYHYAHYEPTKLKHLDASAPYSRRGTGSPAPAARVCRLYKVVRQTIRTPIRSYSLKAVRTFFMESTRPRIGKGRRGFHHRVRKLASDRRPDHSRRRSSATTKKTACRPGGCATGCSNERRTRSGSSDVVIPWRENVDRAALRRKHPTRRSNARARSSLLDPSAIDPTSQERRWQGGVARARADYHRREAKPGWWAYFGRREASSQELLDDTLALAGLQPTALPVVADNDPLHPYAHVPAAGVQVDCGQRHRGSYEPAPLRNPRLNRCRTGTGCPMRGPSFAAVSVAERIIAGEPPSRPPLSARRSGDLRMRRSHGAWGAGRYRGASRSCCCGSHRTWLGRAEALNLQTIDLVGSDRFRFGARRELPVRAGAAGIGQDLDRRAPDRGAARRRASAWRRGDQPQGDSQSARRGRARGRELTCDVPRAQEGEPRRRVRLHGQFIGSTQRQQGPREDADGPEIQSSPARRGCSRDAAMDCQLDYLFIDEAGQVSLADASRWARAPATRAPRRSPAARAGLAGHPPAAPACRCSSICWASGHRAADRGLFLTRRGGCIPTCAGSSPNVLRRPAALGAGLCTPANRLDGLSGTGLRYCRSNTSATRSSRTRRPTVIARGGRRLLEPGRSPIARATPPLHASRHPRRRALQHAGAVPARAAAGRRRGRERSTSSRAARRRSCSSRWRPPAATTFRAVSIPVQPESPERRDLAREMHGGAGGEPAAAGDALPNGGSDAVGQWALPVRRAGTTCS